MNRKVKITPVLYDDLYSYDFTSTAQTNQYAWIDGDEGLLYSNNSYLWYLDYAE